jgi:hypothetical protein
MKIYFLRLLALPLLFCFVGFQPVQAQQFAHWEKEIAAFQQADQQTRPPKKSIVFTGSSSIRLWENLDQDFPGKKILNRGFGGSQTDAVTFFADQIVVPYKPKQVVIYVGDNDLSAGKSPEKVLADFKDLFFKIRNQVPKATITFIAIKPSPSRIKLLEAVRETNTLVKGFLGSQQKTGYVDIYTPMLQANGKPKPALFRADSLHMTRAALRPYLK